MAVGLLLFSAAGKFFVLRRPAVVPLVFSVNRVDSRRFFGESSHDVRALFPVCSGVVRLLFGVRSGFVRIAMLFMVSARTLGAMLHACVGMLLRRLRASTHRTFLSHN